MLYLIASFFLSRYSLLHYQVCNKSCSHTCILCITAIVACKPYMKRLQNMNCATQDILGATLWLKNLIRNGRRSTHGTRCWHALHTDVELRDPIFWVLMVQKVTFLSISMRGFWFLYKYHVCVQHVQGAKMKNLEFFILQPSQQLCYWTSLHTLTHRNAKKTSPEYMSFLV